MTEIETDDGREQEPERISVAELRTLFLFEKLEDDKLRWLSDRGRVQHSPVGPVYLEGEDATCFYVLIDGTVSLRSRVQQVEVEVNRTSQRGVYAGAMQAYLGDAVPQTYRNSLYAVTECRFFVLPADDFAGLMRDWYPMAMHLLEGLFFGIRRATTLVGQQERLVALGSLTAGLTHELNNPAAAAVRATAALRERVAGMRHKLAMIADGRIDGSNLNQLVGLQEAAVERAAKAPKLGPLEVNDREDEVADRLETYGVRGGYELAPVFVAGGLDASWVDEIAEVVPAEFLEGALRWIGYTVETENLMSEIEDATTRVSTLVGAAKQYSQMDRAPYQLTDVNEGLESTLVMLGGKLRQGITVVRRYDRDLPAIPAYAGELNQVWTNLIDNAVAAMAGRGTLTVSTSRLEDHVLIEVADTGPGISDEVRPRIFEPFFTTKSAEGGTGLGLDISWRIVTDRHRGHLTAESMPGDTRFQVRLPITAPEDVATG